MPSVQEVPAACLSKHSPLKAVLEVLGYDVEQPGIAVAVNGAVVPRSNWGMHQVESADEIEVITARQGG